MYLFAVYLTIVLVTHIVKRRKIQLLLHSGLEIFYREAVVAWLMYPSTCLMVLKTIARIFSQDSRCP